MKFCIRTSATLCFLSIVLLQCKTSETAKSTVAAIENRYWKLAEMNGIPVITPENEKEVHVILAPEGAQNKLKGFAGCNSIAGSYTLSDNMIKFEVISTKMMCDPSHMDVENFLLTALSSANAFSVDGETLELFEGDTALANFKAVDFK